MPTEDKEKSYLDSYSINSKVNHDKIEPLNSSDTVIQTCSEVPEKLDLTKESNQLKQAYFFSKLLFAASIIISTGTAIFSIDLLPAVLLGCGIVAFNYFWTMQFVRKLLQERKLKVLDLLFSFTKFGISVITLFLSMQYLYFSPVGLLIGISNIALAVVIYSFIRIIKSQ